MFDLNSGYSGYSRSKASSSAIDSYELPLSLMNKNSIKNFTSEYKEYEKLKDIPVYIWKYQAKLTGASSWHHTGIKFKKTDHYSLFKVGDDLLEKNIDELKKDYKNSKKLKEEEQKNYYYTVLYSQIWGGTRKHPKIVDYEYIAGIEVGDWVYHKDYKSIKKAKTTANKIEKIYRFNSYKELVKNFPQFKGNVKKFNEILKEKNLK
jgi:hypothetical protein